ncbi:hypothetical protein LAUMK7_01462 [Mycobacterium kansasii]|nr:hypothetical protein LAUMK22_00835 [Mycobacterium kansasii]VAZ65464.1 hypothetical protein LAUMK40_01589 [Mycobacterium kansasii]VAZ72703.1 hypothetical protein LAUMK7_01462 [Mycobacterium kansasii]
MVIGAEQYQVVQLGGATVFPMAKVVCVQATGGAATGYCAGLVAVLESAAQPAVDHAGRPPGADELAVAFEPDFGGGITAEVAALGVG